MKEFHVAPRAADGNNPHAHQWLLEFSGSPPDLRQFGHHLDEWLQRINAPYRNCRLGRDFGPPEVIPVPGDTFHRWLHKDLGDELDVQNKVPRLSDDRVVADGLLSIMGRTEIGPDTEQEPRAAG